MRHTLVHIIAHEKEMHYVIIKQWEHGWGIVTLEEKEQSKKKKKCYKFLPWIPRIIDGSRKFLRRLRLD